MAKYFLPFLLFVVFMSCKKEKNNSPVVENQSFEIEENSSIGTSLGFVQAYDAEDDLLQYELIGVDNDFPFQININTGELTVSNSDELDFEELEQHVFVVKIYEKDALDYTSSSTISVKLLNVPEVPLNGMVAYYPFNSNANDESGNNFDGGVFGASLVKGYNGQEDGAYSFDGYNDYINIGNVDELKITGDLTISVWIKPESFSGVRGIITCQGGNTDKDQTNALYRLIFQETNYMVYTHETGDGFNNNVSLTTGLFNLDTWFHFVVTRNISEKKIGLYVNGLDKGTFSYSENPNNGDLATIKIGINHGTHSNNQRHFKGALDEIIIYNKLLSEEEINDMY